MSRSATRSNCKKEWRAGSLPMPMAVCRIGMIRRQVSRRDLNRVASTFSSPDRRVELVKIYPRHHRFAIENLSPVACRSPSFDSFARPLSTALWLERIQQAFCVNVRHAPPSPVQEGFVRGRCPDLAEERPQSPWLLRRCLRSEAMHCLGEREVRGWAERH